MAPPRTPVLEVPAPTEPRVAPGAVLDGKYRVDRVLAEGGMGYVVAATHLTLHERVALKFLLPEVVGQRHLVERFVREAQAAARLKGEHIARVLDVGALANGAPYMVMEYLDGADLAALITARGALPPGEAVDCALPVCEALAEAHARGIVHRDIKPGNVFLARRPDGSRLVKVLDFGISKVSATDRPALTRSLAAMGTPAYMSPEQMRSSRDVDGRADIWALGVVLYECVAGRRPFDADSMPALCILVTQAVLPPLPPWLPARLAEVVQRCLEKDPDRRYATMGELAAALAPHAHDASAARTVVERTRALEAGVTTLEPGRIPAARAPLTTLGAATMVIHGARGRRRATIAAVLVVIAVAGTWAAARSIDRRATTAAERTAGWPSRASDDAAIPEPADAGRAPGNPVVAETSSTMIAIAPVVESVLAPPRPGRASPAVEQSRTSPPRASGGPTPSPPPAVTLTIRIDSVPAGATVSRAADGVELGSTPFATEELGGAGRLRYRLTLPGHLPETVAFDLDQASGDQHRTITLRPIAVPAPADAGPHDPPHPPLRGRGQPASPADL